MMRRPIVIILGFIVLVLIVLVLLFGLKGPEMPIQEVHKVIPMSKFQQQTATPAIPAIPRSSNNVQSVQQPIPAMPQQHGAVPSNISNNVGSAQPISSTVPQTTQPQSTVPLIIPQSNNPSAANANAQHGVNPQQSIPAMPQPGNGNLVGAPAQQ